MIPPPNCRRCGEPAKIRLYGPHSEPLCHECAGTSPASTLGELAEQHPGAWPIIASVDEFIRDLVAVQRRN